MSSTTTKSGIASRYLTRQFTITWAVIFTLAGLLLLILGSAAGLGWLESVGSTLLSIGLVTLVTEYFLRSIFTHELLELIQLRDHVREAGFSEAALESQVDWDTLYKRSRSITLVLPDPRGWLSREWALVLAAALAHPCDVRIYLPDDHDSLMVSYGASLLGLSEENYAAALSMAEKKISSSWTKSTRNPGSEISVFRLSDPTSYSIVGLDDSVTFILHNVNGAPGLSNLGVRFATENESAVQAWAHASLAALAEREFALYYELRSPTSLEKEPRS